jgi:hypothetical protein
MKLLILCLPFSLTSISASACSISGIPTSADVFRSSVAVFRGTITRAEIVNRAKQDEEKNADSIHIIKVYWRVDEVFKGKNLVGKSALTSTFYCFTVPIVVGQQYVFSVSPFTHDENFYPRSKDAIGELNSFGTESDFFSQVNYEQRLLDFRKLSKRK